LWSEIIEKTSLKEYKKAFFFKNIFLWAKSPQNKNFIF